MGINWQSKEGWGSINAYALPGIPYLFNGTASDPAEPVRFPLVSKYVEVKNTATGGATRIRVGFSQNGIESGSQYVVLGEGDKQRFDVRVTEVWVMADAGASTYDISAGLSSAALTTPLSASMGPAFEGVG